MADLLLELFSEEIPARMQAQAADNLARLLAEALAPLTPADARTLYGPRRIAWMGAVAPEVPASTINERGPKLAAPEQALAGFLRKHGATQDDLRQDGGYWLLEKSVAGRPAAASDRRGRPLAPAAFSLAEIDALGRDEPIQLGPPAASHPLRARWRGGALHAGKRRG